MTFSGYLWLVYLTCTVLVFISPVDLAPMPDQYSRGVDWLSRYGYLPPPDPRTGKLQTKEGIERAIREMQRFAGLKDTGKLDDDTLKLMSTPRCSLPDIIGSEDMLKKRRRKRRYATTGLRWKKSNITWSILNYPSLPPYLQLSDVQNIMTYAFKAWSDVTNLNFYATSSSEYNRADIKISFVKSLHDDGYPFDGKGGTLAHAFFPGEADISGDTHFDDEEIWTSSEDNGGTDLFAVAVHEFGHALGLSHSSSNPSIMQPYYQGPVGHYTSYSLPEDDRFAIQSLYGSRSILTTPSPNHPTTRLPHPPSPPRPKIPSKPDPSVQNRCEGGFDAVANIRGEVFFFKGPYFWRIQQTGSLVSLQPALIKNFWIGLPPGTNKIDAVYERKMDSRIIFFIGSQYWVFKDNVATGNPRPLSEWGLVSHDGSEVKRVDAAFIWAHNGKTYIFSGGEFWRFSEGQGSGRRHIDAGYPRSSSLWKGTPSNPDDIITWKDGDACFFKGNSYWILKSGGLDQDNVIHKSTAVDWMKCPEPSPTTPPKKPRQGEDCNCGLNGALQMSASSWLLCIILLLYPGVLI